MTTIAKIFNNVKVLIWDFDGTLYPPNTALFKAIREAEYRVIMDHLKVNRTDAIEQFDKYYKKITPSATQTVAKLCHITTSQAAEEMEKYYDRRQYLKKDPQLNRMFKKLKNFRHFILANGVRFRIEQTLIYLGVPVETFKEIVTSEIVGENKPSLKGFKYILKKTGLSPEQHLMIGDRESVDIKPANKLGLKTCLVWSEARSLVTSYTIKEVYQIPLLFGIK